jgi:hypothetical protein
MNSCFHSIKRKIQILIFSINLVTFILIILFTNNKNDDNYIEYTTLTKFLSNIYIILIFLILLIDSISHKLICSYIKDNISFLSNDIGKAIINLLIGILFWSSNNNAHVIFGIINFVSSLVLFLCQFIIHFKILKYIHFDTESSDGNSEEKKTNQSSYETANSEHHKKEEKNGSILPLNINQISYNGFDQLKQHNLKAQK